MRSRSPRVGITAFLCITSALAMAVIIAVSLGSLSSMRVVGQRAQEVRQVKLPEVEEIQRSLINIESLRRVAEVVYIAGEPQTRRMARIKAQAMSNESVFTRNTDFYAQAKKLTSQINDLAAIRDAEYANRQKLRELGTSFIASIFRLTRLINDESLNNELVDAALTLSLFRHDTGSTSREARIKRKKLRADNEAFFRTLERICARQSSSRGVVAECSVQRGIQAEYQRIITVLDDDIENAFVMWQSIDGALQEMRDMVRTGAEFETMDALTSIENTSNSAIGRTLWLAVGGVAFFVLYLLLLLVMLVRPIRWTGRKLVEIQQGVLHNPAPHIHITELYQVGDLLDRFSVHIAELTSHASMLEEDAAIKKDLEELMSAVFKVSVDGYVVWNPERKITVNTGLLRILGYAELSELEKDWEVIGFTKQEDLQPLYDKVLAEGFLRKEMTITTVQGKRIPFEVSYLPLKRQDGMSVFSYFRDLRQQKMTEGELRKARDRAEDAARVKSDFLARMSHEIRTPMNGVLGLTAIALKNSPPPSQKHYLEKIQASARILLRVINDILDFSKMESGGFSLEKSPFPFSRLLTTVTDFFSLQAGEKGLYFRVEASADIPDRLVGDELRLSQVLLNLCGNAMKFTEKGGVTIRVDLERREDPLLYVRFSIIDTGIGMTQEQLASLFKPFSQADSSTTRKYGGTGLGLVISELLVKMMQGSITVTSAPEYGSTFSFVVTLETAPDQAQDENGEEPGSAPQDMNGLRILLAEDNEINQEVAVALLEELGCSVIVASNGEEAIKILERTPVDCVLMDIQMPVMDGLTATKLIRQHDRESVSNVPVIAMTAHAMKEDREKSFEAGMDSHITKPIDVEELRSALSEVRANQL